MGDSMYLWDVTEEMIREWTELERAVYRWRIVADMVSWEEKQYFETQVECDRIVARLKSCNHYCTIFEDHVVDDGWRLDSWGDHLAKAYPELVNWEGEWFGQDGNTGDLCATEIVQECYKRFPHVDTTVFIEFRDAALPVSTAENDISLYEFEDLVDWLENRADFLAEYAVYRKAKARLRRFYKRGFRVGERIHMLARGERGQRLPISDTPLGETRVNVDLTDYMVTISSIRGPAGPQSIGPLLPHEAQYINALVEAKRDGVQYVTEAELKELPGCRGRNVSRDFNGQKGVRPVRGIKQKYPQLWKIIGVSRGNGRYLKV